jgi:hypothetical protein
MQAAIAMEQRAKVMGKAGAAAVYRSFINSMKDKTEEMREAWSQKYKKSIDCSNPKGFSQKAHCQGRKKKMKEHIEEAVKMTALERFRKAAAEREKKHDDAEKEMKARHAAGKENMSGAIDRLEKHLNKEETHSPKNRGGADSYYGRPYDNPHKVGSQEHKDYHEGYHGTEFGQKDYGTPRGAPKNRMREDSPTNAAGTGAVAGLGVGPQGEPGVNMKKKKKVIPFAMFTRKMPD